ncbi:MAG: transporter substrate-binding domain-containing protein [Hahellaceae bacterium]|nr:transporter substrate-binding domain-containing protein [Hahellaceae bacterium]MCP5211700.1 transporter substrate-binding domain-containing protein [Hahellaceae bacterium]
MRWLFTKCLSFWPVRLLIWLGFTSYAFAQSAALDLTPEEAAYIQNHTEITVTNEFDWPPFDFTLSGEPAGLGIDLMELLADRIGVRFRYINGYTWDELVKMFMQGEIDVIHSLSITPEREEAASFSEPYYHSKNVIITRTDNLDIQTLADLSGKIIALPAGWSSIEFFKRYDPSVHIIEVASSREALEYVDQGKVVATIEQEGIVKYFIKKFGFHDLKLSRWIDNDELQATSSMHFAVLKTNPVLFGLLTKAHSTITAAEIETIEAKWLGKEGREIGREDVGLTPEEREYLKEKGSIRYALSPNHLPFEDIKGAQGQGMVTELLEVFSERLGVPFTLVKSRDKNHAVQLVLQGESDIVPMLKGSDLQNKVLEFTSVYLDDNIVIIANENLPFIADMTDLAGKTVGLSDRLLFDKVSVSYPGLNFKLLAESTEDALIRLSSGKIDALLLSLPEATHNIRQLGLTNLKVAANTPYKSSYRIGISKQDPQLHSIMSKVVRSLTTQDIDNAYQKWVVLKFQHEFDYRQLWLYGAFALLGITVVLSWNFRLRSLNRQLEASHHKLEQTSRDLEILSSTDGLTGLFNRHHFEQKMQHEMERAKRYQSCLTLLLLDIDHFKSINDTHGHQVGDQVLVCIAGAIRERVRKTDIAARWGGEEFVIVLPETDLTHAQSFAESLRQHIASVTCENARGVTVSIGVAAYQPDEILDAIFGKADRALYKAKESGRNRVVLDN